MLEIFEREGRYERVKITIMDSIENKKKWDIDMLTQEYLDSPFK